MPYRCCRHHREPQGLAVSDQPWTRGRRAYRAADAASQHYVEVFTGSIHVLLLYAPAKVGGLIEEQQRTGLKFAVMEKEGRHSRPSWLEDCRVPAGNLNIHAAAFMPSDHTLDGDPLRISASGTCRDFALLLCSPLYSHDIAAQVRCGFANYLGSPWEDHWVCEYWDEPVRTWLLSDAQMDSLVAVKCGIEFDPTDVPRHAFMTAGEA
jgi:hypothetical protein